MNEFQLALTDPERQFLIEMLQSSLKPTQVEEHRTRVLAYRADVLRRKQLLMSLLEKVAIEFPAPTSEAVAISG